MSSVPLSVQKLTKRFEAGTVNEKLALDGLSLEVPAGQFVTVLGSNGSFFAVNHRDNAYFRDLLATRGMGLEDRMKTKMGLLSGGQRQAASLLMATVARPKLLLLDEHTAALDPGAAEKVMEITGQIVARDKITTLMNTHDMDYALSMGSRTIMLSGGRVVLDLSGPERQAMTAGALAERFYTRPGKRVEAETISAKNENSL